jgi:hypothetical protein
LLARFSLLSYNMVDHYWFLLSAVFAGGTLVYKTVSRSFGGEKKFESHGVDMKALQARVAKLEEEAIKRYSEGELERAEKHKPCADLKSNAYYKKPEDVISVFMMKEFMGKQFLDDLMYPEVGRSKP